METRARYILVGLFALVAIAAGFRDALLQEKREAAAAFRVIRTDDLSIRQMRAFAEKGVSQARDNYAKFKDVAESHNGTMEAVFTTASKGASEFSAKLIEIVKANTTANLDFAQSLFGVKSPSEAIELWTSHARKQFETFTANAKELAELTQRVSAETVEPIKNNASKLFKPAA